MKKTIVMLLFGCIVSLSSCQAQEYEKGIFDLGTLKFNFNAGKFYARSLEKENLKMSSGKQYVQKDTITEYDLDWDKDKNTIVGIQYNVIGYSPADTVAVFQNIYFSRMEAMTDKNGKLMLVEAVASCSRKDYKKLIENLIQSYGQPVSGDQTAGFTKSKSMTWRLDDRIIQLVSEATLDFSDPHSIVSEKEKAFITATEKQQLNETYLFLCKPEFETRLKGKLHSGEWSRFE